MLASKKINKDLCWSSKPAEKSSHWRSAFGGDSPDTPRTMGWSKAVKEDGRSPTSSRSRLSSSHTKDSLEAELAELKEKRRCLQQEGKERLRRLQQKGAEKLQRLRQEEDQAKRYERWRWFFRIPDI